MNLSWRAAWRHEQQSIVQALATFTHHSARRQKTARAGEEGHEDLHNPPRRQKPLPPEPKLFDLSVDEEPNGVRLDRLAGVRPQERIQRHTVEQIDDSAPDVPSLDAPVPPMAEQLSDVLFFMEMDR